MAYNKGIALKNDIKSFSHLLMGVAIFKFAFFLYSFISFFFWFLNCFEIDWLYLFNWLFIVPYKFVMLFYRPTGLSADFSLAIIGIFSLVCGLLCEFLSDQVYQKIFNLQEELERYSLQKKRERKRVARPISADEMFQQEYESSMPTVEDHYILLFIIHPNVKKIKIKETDKDLTFQETELWKQRVNKRILEVTNYSKPLQKGYYRKNLFLVYKDFNYVDDFIYYIKPAIQKIIEEFKGYGIDLQFNYVLSSISQLASIEKELDVMDIILSLNFMNTFILTNRFKNAYDRKTSKKFMMDVKGEYNLSKNLSISNIQPLFIFKNLVKQGV